MKPEEFKAKQKSLKLKNYQIALVFGKTTRTIVSYRNGSQPIPDDLVNLLNFLVWLNERQTKLWDQGKAKFFSGEE